MRADSDEPLPDRTKSAISERKSNTLSLSLALELLASASVFYPRGKLEGVTSEDRGRHDVTVELCQRGGKA